MNNTENPQSHQVDTIQPVVNIFEELERSSFESLFPKVVKSNNGFKDAIVKARRAEIDLNSALSERTYNPDIKELAVTIGKAANTILARVREIRYATGFQGHPFNEQLNNLEELVKSLFNNNHLLKLEDATTADYVKKANKSVLINTIEVVSDKIYFDIQLDSEIPGDRRVWHRKMSFPLDWFKNPDALLEKYERDMKATHKEVIRAKNKEHQQERLAKKVSRKLDYLYVQHDPVILESGTVFDKDETFKTYAETLEVSMLGNLYYPYHTIIAFMNLKENNKLPVYVEEIEENFLKPLEVILSNENNQLSPTKRMIYRNHQIVFTEIIDKYKG